MRTTTAWTLALMLATAGCLARKPRTGGGGVEGEGEPAAEGEGEPVAEGEGEGGQGAEGEGEGEGEGGDPCPCESDADCDDGDPCNGAETCTDCRCMPGAPPDCDDGIGCTEDGCAPAGCLRLPVHSRCGVGQICLPESGGCTRAPVCRDDGDCVLDDPCLDGRCDPVTRTCWPEPFDGDGDGHPPLVCGGDDCDDSTPLVAPALPERCNGVDDDCDGEVDEGCAEEGDVPSIAVVPPGPVVFEDVPEGAREVKRLVVHNAGGGELELRGIEVENNADGGFSVDAAQDSPHHVLPARLSGEDPGDFMAIEVAYRPARAGEDSGRLRLLSNDAGQPELVVELRAGSVRRCVEVTPPDIDFRIVRIGASPEATVEVTNCGNADLVVTSLTLVEGTSGDFSLLGTLDGLLDGCLADRDAACEGAAVIEPGATGTFVVGYAPSDEGADGGRVELRTNVPGSETVEVDLFGRGGLHPPPECLAEARIAGAAEWGEYPDRDNRLETVPLKTIELRATGSVNPGEGIVGEILGYEWTVLERPEGSTAEVAPHDGAPEATFFLDLAGSYVFELEVTNERGMTSESDCQVHAAAVPDEDLHLQLVWHTPADPDETDTGFGAGSDVDLHFLHPLGDWFCAPRDVYYANAAPDWAVPFDPSDDPSLDIDDTDGAGPENINLNHPEDNRQYTVGVHYFNDHGYGPSFVTVRIFVQAVLRLETEPKRMAGTDQFWEVATIDWPGGEIGLIDELYDARPNEDCE